jgi:hypothetical protein
MPDIVRDLRALVRSRACGRCECCGVAEKLMLAEHEIDHATSLKQ